MKSLHHKSLGAKLWVTLALMCSVVYSSIAMPAPISSQKQVWAISIDNDLFSPVGSSDRDFTGGMALTYSASEGAKYWRSLDGLLAQLDRFTEIGRSAQHDSIIPSIEVGLYGFTPDDFTRADIAKSDRPYASLAYLSVSRLYQLNAGGNALSSSLTLGLLGAGLFNDVQSGIHRAVGTDEPQGWHNQISDGGEFTARYQLAYHDYWQANTASSRFKTTYYSSLGYLTEAGIALSTRQGLISSPDNRFNPELISYGERVNETAATPYQGTENYFWGGVTVKARLYNAFLQGQFRSSVHTLSYGNLRPFILEAWIGYTLSFARNYKASYVLRAQTSEIRSGEGDRAHVWGGLVVSHSY